MLVALGLALALMAGEGWDELASIRDTPAAFAAAIAAAEVRSSPLPRSCCAGRCCCRCWWRRRCPSSPDRCRGRRGLNLLVPLYVVLGGGALAEGIAALRSEEASPARCPRPLALALLAAVGLYAVQASYSNDIGFAARHRLLPDPVRE